MLYAGKIPFVARFVLRTRHGQETSENRQDDQCLVKAAEVDLRRTERVALLIIEIPTAERVGLLLALVGFWFCLFSRSSIS